MAHVPFDRPERINCLLNIFVEESNRSTSSLEYIAFAAVILFLHALLFLSQRTEKKETNSILTVAV